MRHKPLLLLASIALIFALLSLPNQISFVDGAEQFVKAYGKIFCAPVVDELGTSASDKHKHKHDDVEQEEMSSDGEAKSRSDRSRRESDVDTVNGKNDRRTKRYSNPYGGDGYDESDSASTEEYYGHGNDYGHYGGRDNDEYHGSGRYGGGKYRHHNHYQPKHYKGRKDRHHHRSKPMVQSAQNSGNGIEWPPSKKDENNSEWPPNSGKDTDNESPSMMSEKNGMDWLDDEEGADVQPKMKMSKKKKKQNGDKPPWFQEPGTPSNEFPPGNAMEKPLSLNDGGNGQQTSGTRVTSIDSDQQKSGGQQTASGGGTNNGLPMIPPTHKNVVVNPTRKRRATDSNGSAGSNSGNGSPFVLPSDDLNELKKVYFKVVCEEHGGTTECIGFQSPITTNGTSGNETQIVDDEKANHGEHKQQGDMKLLQRRRRNDADVLERILQGTSTKKLDSDHQNESDDLPKHDTNDDDSNTNSRINVSTPFIQGGPDPQTRSEWSDRKRRRRAAGNFNQPTPFYQQERPPQPEWEHIPLRQQPGSRQYKYVPNNMPDPPPPPPPYQPQPNPQPNYGPSTEYKYVPARAPPPTDFDGKEYSSDQYPPPPPMPSVYDGVGLLPLPVPEQEPEPESSRGPEPPPSHPSNAYANGPPAMDNEPVQSPHQRDRLPWSGRQPPQEVAPEEDEPPPSHQRLRQRGPPSEQPPPQEAQEPPQQDEPPSQGPPQHGPPQRPPPEEPPPEEETPPQGPPQHGPPGPPPEEPPPQEGPPQRGQPQNELHMDGPPPQVPIPLPKEPPSEVPPQPGQPLDGPPPPPQGPSAEGPPQPLQQSPNPSPNNGDDGPGIKQELVQLPQQPPSGNGGNDQPSPGNGGSNNPPPTGNVGGNDKPPSAPAPNDNKDVPLRRQRRGTIIHTTVDTKNAKPARGVKVQLYEQDTFNFDDLLDETETDKKGEFEVNGSENELNFLRPYMWITHSCPSQFVGNKNCTYKSRVQLPHFEMNTTHELSTIMLGGEYPYEKISCE